MTASVLLVVLLTAIFPIVLAMAKTTRHKSQQGTVSAAYLARLKMMDSEG